MVLLDELRVTMSDYQKDMDELYEVLGVAAATERYNALQEEIAKDIPGWAEALQVQGDSDYHRWGRMSGEGLGADL